MPQRQHVVIEPPGELDPHTAAELERQLVAVPPQVDIVIDMGAVTFCDSKGIAAIITGINHQAASGATLTIRNPNPLVRRLISMCGLDPLLVIEDRP